MRHLQPKKNMQVDNSKCDGTMDRKIKQQRPKEMGMRFNWVIDRVKQKNWRVLETWS